LELRSFVVYSNNIMSRPLIGLTTSRGRNKNGLSQLTITEAYVQALTLAGALPVMLPLGAPDYDLEELLTRLDGLLLTGGGDVAPERYGSRAHPLVSEVDQDRDRVEIQLIQSALERELPVLGICRGLQVMNVTLGGSLYEDLQDQRPNTHNHQFFPEHPRSYQAHLVTIENGSHLQLILSTQSAQVNSFHHQGIRRLARGTRATAFAPDGVIEGLELEAYPFGLAVQWHPEWLPDQPEMRALFQAFIEAAGQD
jgi:putative glutamine amidotransferase